MIHKPSNDLTDKQLDDLLNELSYLPADNAAGFSKTPLSGTVRLSHQAPLGTAGRILAALPKQTLKPAVPTSPSLLDTLLTWLGSPLRATAAGVLPLLLGVVIGGTTQNQATDLFADANGYPLNDQMLVLAGLTDDFTNELSLGFDASAAAGAELFEVELNKGPIPTYSPQAFDGGSQP